MSQQSDGLMSVFLPSFEKDRKRLGLTEEERDALASDLMLNPKAGPVIRGTGGARKLRYALANRGKSAGARIIYADFSEYHRLYFLTAYAKREKANLTAKECNELKKLLNILEQKLQEKSP
ncbi:MAG: type II toxin-antitoxin system RelE/ParE family toxin [Oscillibacter sp.]|nr:type II toxin-antitoxin system RelE/ParE family toxin [Oscillibacter sp.]